MSNKIRIGKGVYLWPHTRLFRFEINVQYCNGLALLVASGRFHEISSWKFARRCTVQLVTGGRCLNDRALCDVSMFIE